MATTEEKMDQLRELIHEANGVLSDLRREMKEAKVLVTKLAPDLVEARLKEEVSKGLATYDQEVRDAMDRAVEKVMSEFDKLYDTLMGGEKRERRVGTPTIPELIEKVAEADRRLT